MKRIARFEKVSWEQFFEDCMESIFNREYSLAKRCMIEEKIREWYDGIKLPKRATSGSAGYDFYLPFDIHLRPEEVMKFPTGIRCEMEPGWMLSLYPRSGLGFKYGIRFSNTIGIIDSDYYKAANEGHMWAKLVNDMPCAGTVLLKQGTAFCQGIFTEYGITYDDDTTSIRNGGLGSTDGTGETKKVQ